MFLTCSSDRAHEKTELLRRCKGVFSKTRRTLTYPPQFCITRVCGPEGLTTTAFLEIKHSGTDTPAHNCRNRNSDADYALTRDWNPSLLFYKGTVPCKHNNLKKHFLPERSTIIFPVTQYISDRRPCGVTRQQLDSVVCFFGIVNGITLSRLLNGSAGYCTDSEDTPKSPGWFCCIQLTDVHNQNTKTITVIPDICLERRSISTAMYCKD